MSGQVALTFDDGPDVYTEAVVEALRRAGAPATFFVIGRKIEGREHLLRLIIESGHELGNHSMTHARHPDSEEIELASRRIESAAGVQPRLFRAPGGNFAEGLDRRVTGLGLVPVKWDVDPQDWSMPGAGAIRDRVASGALAGSIVVLHDGGRDRRQTVAAIPGMVADLRARGLVPAKVSDLLAADEPGP